MTFLLIFLGLSIGLVGILAVVIATAVMDTCVLGIIVGFAVMVTLVGAAIYIAFWY